MTNNYVSYNAGDSGSVIRGKLNNAAHDTQKGIKIVNTFADITNINYYDTTSIVFVIDEKKYYKYNGSSWVIYRDIGSGLPTDQITLLHVADNSTEKFDLTDAGLDLAIAEIATGDLLLLPPHIFTQSHTFATKCTVSALFPINSFWIANTSNLVKFTGGITFSANCSIDGIWFYRYVSDNANPVFALTIGGYCTVSNCIIEGGNSFSLSPLAGGGVSTTAYCEFYNCRIRNISSGTSYAVYDQGNEPEFYNCYLGNLQNPNDCFVYNCMFQASGITYRIPRLEVNPSSGMSTPSYSGSIPSILTLSNSSDKNGWVNATNSADSNFPFLAEFFNDGSSLAKFITGYRDSKGGLSILGGTGKRLYLGTGFSPVNNSNIPAITIEDNQNVGIGTSTPTSSLEINPLDDIIPFSFRSYGSSYKIEFLTDTLTGTRAITFPNATGTISLVGHTHTFVSLTDVPSSYSGQGSKFVKVNSAANALEFTTTPFTSLSDVPNAYTSQALKLLRVNAGANAIEFATTAEVGVPTLSADNVFTGSNVFNEDGADKDFRVESDTETNAIFVDASTDEVYIGGSTNAIKIGKGGELTFIGTATRWKDELYALVGQNLESPSSDIVKNNSESSVTFKTSATLTDYVTMDIQLNHDWKVGSNIYPHIHWWQTSATMPNWLIQYRWQVSGQAKTTSWTSMKWDANVYTYASGTLNQKTTFGAITAPVNATISDIVQFRIIRDTTNASTLFAGVDGLGVAVDAINFDIHKEVDAVGSKEEGVK